MSSGRPEFLTEEEARALWERALEMQLEAARREDESAAGALVAGAESGAGAHGDVDGLRVEEVTAAAREAGIGGDFMAMALAEREVTRKQERWLRGRGGAGARWLLPDQPRAIELTRIIRASPRTVLDAMQRIFPALPYHLELVDSRGENPLEDGILVFRVPGMQAYTSGATFAWEMTYGTVTHLLLSIRPAAPGGDGKDPAASKVTLRAPLLEHTRQSYWLSLASAGLLGLGGGGIGVAVGLSLVGGGAVLPVVGAGVVLAGSAAMGAGGGGSLGTWGARALYRWGIGKATGALERLLQVVDVNARTGGSFPRPAAGPPPPGDDGLSVLLTGAS
jgi:hypothetical protein